MKTLKIDVTDAHRLVWLRECVESHPIFQIDEADAALMCEESQKKREFIIELYERLSKLIATAGLEVIA